MKLNTQQGRQARNYLRAVVPPLRSVSATHCCTSSPVERLVLSSRSLELLLSSEVGLITLPVERNKLILYTFTLT